MGGHSVLRVERRVEKAAKRNEVERRAFEFHFEVGLIAPATLRNVEAYAESVVAEFSVVLYEWPPDAVYCQYAVVENKFDFFRVKRCGEIVGVCFFRE